MRIYLSASFAARDIIKLHAKDLAPLGHECTSNWLDEPAMLVHDKALEAWQLRARANDDALDIQRSDLVVQFTDWPSTTGGRYWEAGYGSALGKRTVIIGAREQVFHYMSNVEQYDTWEDFLVTI